MSRLPASPLAAIVQRAKSGPRETGATATAAARRARGDVRVVLADVSSSMANMAGARSQYEILRDALAALPGSVGRIAFHSLAGWVPPGAPLPPPQGSTALHIALALCGPADPTHILVVSDGHPDDPRAALAEADRLTAQIDVVFCGPDGDREGLAFMRRLARAGGRVHVRTFREPQRLASAIRTLAITDERPKR